MRRHLLTIGVIVLGAGGCDNVAFGGFELAVEGPPATADADADGIEAAETAESGEDPSNVDGPLLLAGLREGGRATLTLVGEVQGSAIRPFPDPRSESDPARLEALTAEGSEWILFSEGVRVGRLFADLRGSADGYCGAPVTVSGVVELVPDAAQAERLLALPAESGEGRAYGEYRELQHDYDQRVASLEIAQAAIPEYGAPWPRQGVLDARRHIQSFDLSGPGGPFVAATFVHADELAVAPPGQGAYALFVVGERVGAEHESVFTWYRAVDTEGKGAPRYFDHLDWDGDGSDEVLLEVLGSNRRWFAGLGRAEGTWARTFQDACGSGSITGD